MYILMDKYPFTILRYGASKRITVTYTHLCIPRMPGSSR